MKWSLDDLVKVTQGELLSSSQESFQTFSSVVTDTRKELKGGVFVALRGKKFNGHDFLKQALEKKASCLLIDEKDKVPSLCLASSQKEASFSSSSNFSKKTNLSKPVVIKVKDTLKALQDLAHFYRKKNKFRVLAVTGSVGKTTVKNFAFSLLSKEKKTFTLHKSFNNHIGVPLTLLQAPEDSQVVITELGTNKRGEIKKLTQLVEPDQTLLTLIGTSHREFFPLKEDLVKEKQEIYLNAPHSLQIYNLDQEELRDMHFEAKKKKASCLVYSEYFSKADISLQAQSMSLNHILITGHIQGYRDKVVVPLFGLQNLSNLMAASAFCLGEGLSPQTIWKNLSRCRNFWGRSEVFLLENKATLVFDAYNSSLESMGALLENIKALQWKEGKKYLVLGEIAEVGDKRKDYHEKLAYMVKEQTWQKVWFIGPSYKYFKKVLQGSSVEVKTYETMGSGEELKRDLLKTLEKGDLIALKASRTMKFEVISNFLRKEAF